MLQANITNSLLECESWHYWRWGKSHLNLNTSNWNTKHKLNYKQVIFCSLLTKSWSCGCYWLGGFIDSRFLQDTGAKISEINLAEVRMQSSVHCFGECVMHDDAGGKGRGENVGKGRLPGMSRAQTHVRKRKNVLENPPFLPQSLPLCTFILSTVVIVSRNCYQYFLFPNNCENSGWSSEQMFSEKSFQNNDWCYENHWTEFQMVPVRYKINKVFNPQTLLVKAVFQ